MSGLPASNRQSAAFGHAICERIGIDADLVSDDFTVTDNGGDLARIDLSVYLPADEVRDMFNKAGVASDEEPLGEDVSLHTMMAMFAHEDGRECSFHARLNAWAFGWPRDKKCLRDDHPDLTRRPEDEWVHDDAFGPGPKNLSPQERDRLRRLPRCAFVSSHHDGACTYRDQAAEGSESHER